MKRLKNKIHVRVFVLLCFVTAIVLSMVLLQQAIETKKEPYQLIFISKTVDSRNDFWTSLIDGAELGAEEFDVEIEVAGGSSEEDVDGQIRKIKESIEKGPDAILVAPCDYSKTSDVLQQVVNNGIPLILLDSVIDRDIAVSIVSTDNHLAGKELGEFTRNLLDHNSVIGIIGHVKGTSTAMEREEGIKEGLGEAKEKIADIVYCDSSYEKAYSLTTDMLTRYPDIDVLIGTNEYATVGAARAVKDMELAGKVKMVGFDNSVEEIQLLEEGVLQGIIIQKPFNIGYLGVDQAVKAITGKGTDKKVDSGCKLITKENMYEEENQRLLYPFSGQQ